MFMLLFFLYSSYLCRSTPFDSEIEKTVSNFQLKCVVIANEATTHTHTQKKIKKNIQLICDGVHIRLYTNLSLLFLLFSIRLHSSIGPVAVVAVVVAQIEEKKKFNSVYVIIEYS